MKQAILILLFCGVAIRLFAQTPTIVKATGSYCEGSGTTFYLNTGSQCASYTWNVHGGTKGVDYDYTSNAQNHFSVSWLKPRNSVYVSCSYLCDNNYGTVYSDNFNVLKTVTRYSVAGGGSYCSGGAGLSITLSGSVSNVNYELYANGVPVPGSLQAGNGSPLTWINQKTGGTYTVKASACPVDMSGGATITVKSLPTVYNVGGGGSYCPISGGVSITLSGSQTGVDYQLKAFNSNVGSAIAGTGSSLTWTDQTIGGTYTVVATNATTQCQSTMSGSATVTENTTPRKFSVTGGGGYCSGTQGVPIGLAGSESEVSYQLIRDGADLPISPIEGTGGVLSWDNQTKGVYTVRAMGSSGCPEMMGGEKEVEIISRPTTATAGVDQTGASTCGLTSIALAGNSPTVGTGSWSIMSGSGGSLTNSSDHNSMFINSTGSTYVLRWTISNSPCPASSDDVIIEFNLNPTEAKAGPDQTGSSTCGLTTVTISGNTPTVGSGKWSVISGSGGSFGNHFSPTSTFIGTAGATYVLRWTISNSPCIASTDDVTIKFNVNPTQAPTVVGSARYGTGSLTLVASSANTGEDYEWYSPSNGLLQTGSQYVTPVLNSPWSNYCHVKIVNSAGCKSTSAWVDADIFPLITSSTDRLSKDVASAVLNTSEVYDSYSWRNSANQVVATTPSFVATVPDSYAVIGTKGSFIGTSNAFSLLGPFDGLSENYIITHTMLKEGISETSIPVEAVDNVSQTVQYFDGLGRPMQTVITMGSPNKKDIVQPIVYDEFGREFRKYLPFAPDDNTGRYKENAALINSSGDYIGIGKSFYDNPASKVADDDQDKPFSETRFEPSPLNRVLEQGAPGEAWQPGNGNTIKNTYLTNADNEVLIWTYTVPSLGHPLGLIESPSAYAENTLYKNVTTDEHGNDVVEYVDKQGRTVLKRVQAVGDPSGISAPAINSTNYASTYYAYDDFGNLVCVIQPEGVKNITEYLNADDAGKEAFLQKWGFRYRYDERRRVIMKQVPGADSVSMVYDQRDRLVLTQDGNQRAANQWMFTKYDELNRPIMTGIYTHGSTIYQNQMRDQLSSNAIFEAYDGTASNFGYTNSVFPTANIEVLTVTYYDDYDFNTLLNDPNGHFSYKNDELLELDGLKGQDVQAFDRVRNLITGTVTKVLRTSTFLWSVNYYDDRYRMIQSTSSNFKEGHNRVTNVYDFVGKLLRTKTRYLIPGHATHADTYIAHRFSYDHAGRLLKTWHQILGGAEVAISANEYNELGQLVTKKLHQTSYVGAPVIADPLADQTGTNYDQDITSSSYSSAQSTYVASHSIRLLPGFTVPLNSSFKAKIGHSAEDALAYNNSIDGEYLQWIDYRYNIRGWLKRINDPSAPDSDDLFNMELHYNTPTANGGSVQYNGNISEAIWKSAGLDKQSYGYDYDPMNRIMEASYYNLAKPLQNGYYDEMIGDPDNLAQYPAYDLNGNIQNLSRNGKTDIGTYGLMDKLDYDYGPGGGNRLMFVSDGQATSAEEQGFKEIVEGTTDYAYDENGNLTTDENKGVVGDVANGVKGIEYNHLNLPWKVSKSATEYIIYTYDATGRKLAQEVFGSTPKKTEYLGELVLEDNALQIVLQPEGRVVLDSEAGAPDPWEYQYFLKDHLGNTRVVFSEKKRSEEHKATFEDDRQNIEMNEFQHYPAVRSSMNEFDHTDAGTVYNKSLMLHGGQNNQVGLARSFEVNPGDVFDLEVYAKYLAPPPSSPANSLNGLFTEIASAFSLGTATSPLDGASAYSAMENMFQSGGPWINSGMWDDTAPKAYLNYILFDENFLPVDFGFDQISTDGEQDPDLDPISSHDYLSLHLKVEEKGYLYVYLSNEQPTLTNVYFDDMKIVHYSAVEQVSDYYPFGLTFNSYQRENSISQDYKYNGKEEQTQLNLSTYDYGARMYDPAIGRWWQVDPFSNAYYSYSPYSYVTNNPVIYIDENGQFKIPIHRRITQNALSRLGFSKRWFRIDLLAGNTIIADIFGAGEDIHFDGRKNFTEVNNTWNSLNSEIKKASLGNTTWGGAHTQHFGKLLHNVQDFYAHSNYIELFIDWYVEHFGSTPSSTEIPTYDEAVASPAYEDFRKNYLEKSLRTGEFNLGRWIAGNDAQRTNEEGNVHHDQLAKDKRNVGQNYGGTTLHDLAVFVATVHTMNALNSASGGSSGSGKKKKEPDVDKRRGKKTGGW